MRFLGRLLSLIAIGIVIAFLFSVGSAIVAISGMSQLESTPPANSILVLDMNGIILDGEPFLTDLRKFREDPNIKGVLVRINSPGGVVGASQELYAELKRTKEEFAKPVVASCNSLAASGAFYAAMGADKIVVNPGTLLGSIGVIIEFANLERLYDWAKIERYALKTGTYKDAGAEYKKLTDQEKQMFQGTLDEVLAQFVSAIATGRKMDEEKVRTYADGRIFTGKWAVDEGFADKTGTFTDALRELKLLAGIEDSAKPHLFYPPEKNPGVLKILGLSPGSESSLSENIRLSAQLFGRPLFIMSGQFPIGK